jgi:Na+/H+-dicarboxylate symporter
VERVLHLQVRLIKDELLINVGTSSSETVLPRLLAKLERAGASRETVGVVLPTGYSFKLDGTCIYLTLAALFIVQAGGQDMPLAVLLADLLDAGDGRSAAGGGVRSPSVVEAQER